MVRDWWSDLRDIGGPERFHKGLLFDILILRDANRVLAKHVLYYVYSSAHRFYSAKILEERGADFCLG